MGEILPVDALGAESPSVDCGARSNRFVVRGIEDGDKAESSRNGWRALDLPRESTDDLSPLRVRGIDTVDSEMGSGEEGSFVSDSSLELNLNTDTSRRRSCSSLATSASQSSLARADGDGSISCGA